MSASSRESDTMSKPYISYLVERAGCLCAIRKNKRATHVHKCSVIRSSIGFRNLADGQYAMLYITVNSLRTGPSIHAVFSTQRRPMGVPTKCAVLAKRWNMGSLPIGSRHRSLCCIQLPRPGAKHWVDLDDARPLVAQPDPILSAAPQVRGRPYTFNLLLYNSACGWLSLEMSVR
jgi:hypothetical protein